MKNLKKFNNMGRRRLMGGVVGLGLVALLGAGALTQSALTSHERTLHAPPGKLVSVGTHRLHLNCQGSGQPLVLLESGLSGWSQDWALVQPELAKLTTVCSYDRAGYAWSDDAPESRTGLLAVQDLRTMLRAAGLQGPMVVVGHSWGGMLAQMLAQTNSEEVAGLVLVDALHHDQTASMDPDVHARYSRNMRFLTGSATWLAPLGLTRLAGMPASVVLDKLPASEQVSARALAMQSKNYRALYTEYMGIDPALAVARSLPPVPAVPTIVLSTHALSEFPPGWELDYMRQHWIAGQRALARETAAKHVVVADAGHYLQLERAELVIASVQEVLQKVRLTSPMVSK